MLIADDQGLIRAGLRTLVVASDEFVVVGEARTGTEAVEMATALRPDVVLMDVRMPGLSGAEATAQIRRQPKLVGTRILIVTTFEGAEVARACIKAGADGFIGKSVSTEALIEAIRAVVRGERPFSPRAARVMLDEAPGAANLRSSVDALGLTEREVGIVRVVALGLTNEEIGRRLGISSATVKTHVRNAMRKLDAHDRGRLVALAHQLGLAP